MMPWQAKSQALFCPGGASYVSCGDLDVNGTQITVEALVMSVGPSVNIVSKHTGPADVNYLLRPGGVELTTSNGYISAPANFSPTPNECYHVAFTYDGATVKYYVNGCLASSVAHSGTLVTNNHATAIGNQSSCQCEPWNGYIDEVRIWNVARTEAQLQANMQNLPSPTTQTGLLAYYKFSGNYINEQGNATWNGTAVGVPQLLANPTCDNANFTFTGSSVATDVSCAGANDGAVALSAAGGFASYTYSFDGVNYGPSNTLGSLPGGNVNGFARSGIGNCIVPIPTVVAEPAPLSVITSGTNPTCNGYADGTGNLAISGGTPPFTFAWTNGSTQQNPTNLVNGNNTVVITDDNGCTLTDSVVLIEPQQLLPAAYATYVSGPGICDANATSNAQGGTAPYDYSWSNGSIFPVTAGLCQGPTTITITDDNGCVAQQVLNIGVPACLTDVDFGTWQLVGNPANGNWLVQAGGAQLRQTVNGNPTFFVTPVDYINVRMKGRMRTTDGDNDYIGVVFGLKQPLGNSTQYDTWLFDWKQGDQNSNGFTGFEGFALSRINGNIPNTNAALGPTFWGHTNTPEFTVVATEYSQSNGFVRNQFHDIEVLYTTTRAVMIVDNDTIFDIADCFEPGRFGFYNYSQPEVYYTDFTYELFVSFDVEETQVCAGDTAHFTFYEPCGPNNDLSQFDELRWDFGDGTSLVNNAITAANVNPTHVYSTGGNYTVRLIALDALGCRDTIYGNIQVLQLPLANFTVANQCHLDVTALTDATQSSAAIATYQWDFGNGGTAATQNTTVTYATPGVNNVSLIATDAFGCRDTVIQPVEIYALPAAAFGFVPVCDGEPMDMIDISQDATGIVSTTWDLGDGTAANTPLVSHVYANAGTYNVTLDVTSGEGCTSQISQPVTVNPNPVADFTFSQVCAGLTSQFSDASTVVGPSVINTWEWDVINDGSIEYQTQNAQHTFGLGGNYNVELTVTTDVGCTNAVVIPVMSDPIPNASATATEACVGFANDFTDISLIAFGTNTGWEWDFGDGSAIDNTQNPSHTYAAFGDYNVTLTVTSDNGCTDDVTLQAKVHELPVPNFVPFEECYSINYPFSDASTIGAGSITSWDWDFGDASTANTQNPTHTYAAFGTYPVQLTVTSAVGCIDSITQDITLHDIPVAGFTFSAVCEESTMQLLDTSSILEGIIVGWNYIFGGGGTSTDQNPTHAFGTSGNVNVQLAATSDFGCVGTTTIPVLVYPKPDASFSAPSVCLNDSTALSDLSTVNSATIVSLDWDLGDGATDTLPTFNHFYATAGVYDITLMVETDLGCRDTLMQQTEVYELPVADFVFADVCLDFDATFTDQSTTNSGQVNSWQWTLGNGQTSTSSGPVTHSYANAGTYDVTLIVGTDVGCSDTVMQSIIVYPIPVADFTADSVCFGQLTTFVNLSAVDTGTIVSDVWTFGNGMGSEDPNPTHVFATTGYTDVTLSVVSDFGCTHQITLPIRVYVLPEPVFTALDTCAGKLVEFANQSIISEGAISSCAWTTGDGATYFTSNPIHTYVLDGTYSAQLTATSNFGCVDSISLPVVIYPLPIPLFAAIPVEGCVPLPVQFYNTSTIATGYTIDSYEWDLGNGNTAPVSNPTMVYADSGSYNVTLVATSTEGCVDSLTIAGAVTAWPKPIADFVTDTLAYHMIFPKPDVTDLSVGATIWDWDFGDGSTYSEQDPQHAYEEAGTYVITQTVANDFGCADTFGIRIIVHPNLTFFIPNSFSPNDDGLNDTFFGTGEGIKEYEMWVYNRWGQLLFYSKNKDRHWNGKVNDTIVPLGVYNYKFIIQDSDNRLKVYSGNVNVIR